jgi:hypothetical protein
MRVASEVRTVSKVFGELKGLPDQDRASRVLELKDEVLVLRALADKEALDSAVAKWVAGVAGGALLLQALPFWAVGLGTGLPWWLFPVGAFLIGSVAAFFGVTWGRRGKRRELEAARIEAALNEFGVPRK